jgi:hypothetical protein
MYNKIINLNLKIEMKKNLLITVMSLLMTSGCFANVIQFTDEEQKVCTENWDALIFRSKAVGQDALEELKQKYSVLAEHIDYLKVLFVEREMRKATYDYMNYKPRERMIRKQEIDNSYQDSIDVRLIPYNFSIAGEPISLAFRLAKAIGISKDASVKIRNLGLEIARSVRKNPCYDYDVKVMDSLRTFLNRDQLVRILRVKNGDIATAKAKMAWKKVADNGLTANEDSAECIEMAINYYMQEGVVNDMFVGHEVALRKNLSNLWTHQPSIVRMAGALQRKAEMEKKKKEEFDNGFAW